ncbi:hypothetical protein HRbin33_00010 [bacterium HR33]|nr:hypothetical protein HRbin33_00010 [bacterium HR33]
MITVSLVLFAVAAIVGVAMAVRLLRKQQLAWGSTIVHGAAAAAALVLVLLAFLRGETRLGTPLALFVVAALGGFVLVSFHLRQKPHPIPLAVVHGLVAATGFVLLLLAVI